MFRKGLTVVRKTRSLNAVGASEPSALRCIGSSSAFGERQKRNDASLGGTTDTKQKLHQHLGISVPPPRQPSKEALELHKLLRSPDSRPAPRASRPNLHRHARTHVPTASKAQATEPGRVRMLSFAASGMLNYGAAFSSESEAEGEDDVEKIMQAGTSRLFRSEDGREKLREGSFNIDESAKIVLEAAAEEIREADEAETSEAERAERAKEQMDQGNSNPTARRVKEMVIDSIGHTS